MFDHPLIVDSFLFRTVHPSFSPIFSLSHLCLSLSLFLSLSLSLSSLSFFLSLSLSSPISLSLSFPNPTPHTPLFQSGALLFDDVHELIVYELDKDGERDMKLLPDLVAGNWANNSKVARIRTPDQVRRVRE